MASMAAFRPLAALPSSRCAAARPQFLQANKVSASSPIVQAGAAPQLPPSKGGADDQDGRRLLQRREDFAAAGQQLSCIPCTLAAPAGLPQHPPRQQRRRCRRPPHWPRAAARRAGEDSSPVPARCTAGFICWVVSAYLTLPTLPARSPCAFHPAVQSEAPSGRGGGSTSGRVGPRLKVGGVLGASCMWCATHCLARRRGAVHGRHAWQLFFDSVCCTSTRRR